MKSLKQMLTIVNDENIGYNALVYSQFTDTIKNYTKVTKLIKPRLVEHCESSNNYFQFKEPKTTGKKGFYIGSVQLVTKNTSRFWLENGRPSDGPKPVNKFNKLKKIC